MALREIVKLGDERLRQRCQEVADPTSSEIHRIVADLRDTVEDSYDKTGYGRGIAAPQLGEMVRVVYLSKRVLGEELVLVNPSIVARSVETVEVWDACLSFLSIFMRVERSTSIVVEYTDLQGRAQRIEAGPEHDLSELLQHEIDHVDGVLCLDRVEDVKDIVSREVFERDLVQGTPYAKAAGEISTTSNRN